MLKKVLFVVCVMSLSVLFASQVPSFTIERLDGTMIKSEDLLEHGPIFLDFWSTSCQPCQRSMPIYSDFAVKYPTVNFFAVSVDKPRNKNKVVQQVRSKRYAFNVGIDTSGDLTRLFSVSDLPTLFIIDRKGEIILQKKGFTPGDEVATEEAIRRALGS